MFCSEEKNSCQYEYGGISNCIETCTNYSLKNNIKNYQDMHLCKVHVISESKLFWLNKEKPQNQCQICNNNKLRAYLSHDDRRLKENTGLWTILHYLVIEVLKPKGYVLFYQQSDSLQPEMKNIFISLLYLTNFGYKIVKDLVKIVLEWILNMI